MAKISKKKPVPKPKKQKPKKPHSWRLCPIGEHWVQTHPLRIPPSRKHPEGSVTTRHGHCAKNPDVFKPSTPLDPDIVKALIASESGFDPNILADKKNKNSARGLMQITNDTRKILGDEKGELKDHYLTLTREDLNDPSLNICAGIRFGIGPSEDTKPSSVATPIFTGSATT